MNRFEKKNFFGTSLGKQNLLVPLAKFHLNKIEEVEALRQSLGAKNL